MLDWLKYAAKVLVVLASAMLATPVAAQEPNGYPITDVNLRAGPGTEYPVLVTVETEAPVTILGCLPDFTWCDTVFEEFRGWMRSIYLAGYYDGQYYLLRDYAPDLGYQTVTFDIAAYWDSYYRDQPFYNEQHRVAAPRGEGWVDERIFYDPLSRHGSWTWTHGQYVWVPIGVDASWRPYTRGRWVYTDRGWMWVSYEPFGWATYHYGRWGFSSRFGWFWVPGNRWAPAWVSWRQSDDYLAWAPLPPSYDSGITINISFGNVPTYYWSVVPSLYFLSDNLLSYYVHNDDRRRHWLGRTRPVGQTTIINNTTVVNNVINVNYVEQQTKTDVVTRKIIRTRDSGLDGKVLGDSIEVYRPGLRDGRGIFAPKEPKDVSEVTRLSKTKGQGKGQTTTEELLAPPKVRDAVKKRWDRSAVETGTPKLAPELPKGKKAVGPPPSSKKAKVQPVPAQDLGLPGASSKAKSAGQKFPSTGKGEKTNLAPAKKKIDTPGAQTPSGAPQGDVKKAPPQQKVSPPKAVKKAPPQQKVSPPKAVKKAPPQQKVSPPKAVKKAPPQQKASPPQAVKKAPPQQKVPPQAKGKQSSGEKKASSAKPSEENKKGE